jgi:hypothetical protein
MKTRTRTTKENAMATTKKTTKAETYERLMAKTRLGRRIERLGWRRLARIYQAGGTKVRLAIRNEARRCGYTPSTILALHAE